ncbi:prolipoprotein diacylglyceryl transferase, partial [Gammaproteobacteria bacterium AH-315-C21]|nr:prolipoprotein diacylglyceryl transferase [Gammaproteobacteria bacterium AH-315-C21]
MAYIHNIDPIAVSLGPLDIHWYGIMYLLGFAGAWWLGVHRSKQAHVDWTAEQVGDVIFYGAMGVIVGGRLGYMLFYDFANLAADPSRIIRIWEG